MSYVFEATLVAFISVLWAATLLFFTWFYREHLAAISSPLTLPSLSLLFVVVSLGITAGLVVTYARPDAPLVSAFSKRWFSWGWNDNLYFMGVVLDSPVAYGLIVNYQILRCVLGSLLSNAFAPYIQALQSKVVSKSQGVHVNTLLVARLFTDVYGSIAGLTDLILYVSQVDIFCISVVMFAATNALCTWCVLESPQTVELVDYFDDYKKPQTVTADDAVTAVVDRILGQNGTVSRRVEVQAVDSGRNEELYEELLKPAQAPVFGSRRQRIGYPLSL